MGEGLTFLSDFYVAGGRIKGIPADVVIESVVRFGVEKRLSDLRARERRRVHGGGDECVVPMYTSTYLQMKW